MTLSDIIQTEDWYVIPRDNGGAYLIQKTRTEPNWKAIDASGGKISCSYAPMGLAYGIVQGGIFNQSYKALGCGSNDPGYDISPISDNVVDYDNLAEEEYFLAKMNGTLLESPFVLKKIENHSPRGIVRGNLELAHPVKYNALVAAKIALGFGVFVAFASLLVFVFGSAAAMFLAFLLPPLASLKAMGRTR